MALPLDETISAGQSAHIGDHETIATTLNGLAASADGDLAAWDAAGATLEPITRAALATALASEPGLTGAFALRAGNGGRLPVDFNIVMDGSALDGTGLSNKVAFQNTVTIGGGFSGEAGYGALDPGFVWGANDFIYTSPTSGAVDGLTNLCARETEIHLYTPSATIATMKGLQVDCKIESTATSATVTTMFGIYVSSVAADAGSATNAYGAYIEAPTAGTVNNRALFLAGDLEMVGDTDQTGDVVLSGAFTQDTGGVHISGASGGGNVQGAAAGVYIGELGGSYGVALADGTDTAALDLVSGKFRVMKANTHESFSVALTSGDTVARGTSYAAAGRFGTNTDLGGYLNVHIPADYKGLTIRGVSGQTANLFELEADGGTEMFALTAAGLPKWTAAGNQQTTVGAAGGASALPATPTKYLKVVDSAGTTLVIPAYAAS